MVLRSDVDAPARQIAHRMIRAMVSYGETSSCRSRGTTDDLMPETYAEEWFTVRDQCARKRNGSLKSRWVTRSWGEDHAARRTSEHLVNGGGVRMDSHAKATRTECAHDVCLQPKVNHCYERLVHLSMRLNAAGRHLADKVLVLPTRQLARSGDGRICICLPRCGDPRSLRPCLAQASCKATRLNTRDRWNAMLA